MRQSLWESGRSKWGLGLFHVSTMLRTPVDHGRSSRRSMGGCANSSPIHVVIGLIQGGGFPLAFTPCLLGFLLSSLSSVQGSSSLTATGKNPPARVDSRSAQQLARTKRGAMRGEERGREDRLQGHSAPCISLLPAWRILFTQQYMTRTSANDVPSCRW